MKKDKSNQKIPGKRKFHGSFEEDSVKKSRREGDRKRVIAEKGIEPDVRVRIKNRDKIWVVEDITADYFVRLKGAGMRVSPDDLEVISDG